MSYIQRYMYVPKKTNSGYTFSSSILCMYFKMTHSLRFLLGNS